MRTKLFLIASLIAALSLIARTGSANPIITGVVETGGDLDMAGGFFDTGPAQWSGVTFTSHQANEPVPGILAGDPYTVGLFQENAPSFVDRSHRYAGPGTAGAIALPIYLVGGEYIMSGNDNRDNAAYTLDVTVSMPVIAYMLIDNRLQDGDNATPPTFGPANMQWILDEGWAAVTTGNNRAANPAIPDELGFDEGADGTLNQWYSVYAKRFPAGTFRLKQADNAGRNMFGAVIRPQAILDKFIQLGQVKTGSYQYIPGAPGSDAYTIVGGGNDIWDRWDECAFAYHEVAGDFDIKVQVTELEPAGQWSKAGIMIRDNLAEDSKRVMQAVSPATRANTREFLWRTGINNVDGENGGNHSIGVGNPQYPNAWIRLVRSGSTLSGFAGEDGVNWTPVSSIDTATFQGGALPVKALVGLAVSRHPDAGAVTTCKAVFTNYMEMFPNFCVGGVDSKGCPGKVFVCFNHPVGMGALDPNNYILDPSPGIIETVTPGPTPNVVCLNLEVGVTLTEGTSYTVTVSGVKDYAGNDLGQCSVSGSFIHGLGFELRRIHVQHNRIDGAGLAFYKQTVAYELGQGAWSFGRPGFEGNTVFEDPIPDQGDIERFSSKILGVLSPNADIAARFACSSDDQGELYLSTDDKPAHKVLIAREPEWNGSRQYATLDRRGSPVNQSSAVSLLGGGKYYLEYIYAEGGGGNNGSATWDAGTGAAFVAGQTPVEEANFVPSRYAYNEIFYNLGAVVITKEPQDMTKPIGSVATFDVCLDGTPPYTYQWKRNGVAIPGATGKTYSIVATEAENGATFCVNVNNACGKAVSRNAVLTVLLNPRATNCTSRGNCHVAYMQFNKPMNLDGVYTIICSNTVDGTLSPVVVTGIRHGRSSNEVCLSVVPDLLPDTNVYCVTVLGATSQDGLVIDPNPQTCCFIHGAEYPGWRVVNERYRGVGNGNLAAFVSSPKYINHQPDLVLYNATGFFESPSNVEDNYGNRTFGFYIAPQDGNYFFWMSSDDAGESYIALDANPAHKVKINSEPAWGGIRAWTDAGHDNNDNRGSPAVNGVAGNGFPNGIALTAGQKVYLEGLFTEGGGGDNYAMTVVINDGTVPANGFPPIAEDQFMSMRVAPNGELFTTLCDVFCNPGPRDQKAFIGDRPTFTVTPDGTPPYSIQWKRNGVPIPGANGANYTLPPVTFANLGDVYTACINNEFSTNECRASLNICSNPVVRMCMTWNHPSRIFVKYNKDVKLDGTYTVDDGSEFQVQSIGYGSSMSEVVVNTDPLGPDRAYVLKIEGVTDLDGNPILPDPTLCPFTQGPGRFKADFENGLPPGTISSGTAPPAVDAGVLKLTLNGVTSQANYWTVPVPEQTFECIKATWKSLLNGPTGNGADGYSLNIGKNVGTAFTPEEGAGTGLSVTVDTFDNGGGEVGIETRWNGVRLSFTQIGGGVTHLPVQLNKNVFVDASVEVDQYGRVTFQYDNFTTVGQIPGYSGILANQYVFGARTGGAAEDAWIDDFCFNDYTLGDVQVALPDCPTNTLPECSQVKLTAVVTGSPCYWYQWCRNGVPIPGATNTMYLTPPLRCPDDQGAVFAVKVRNHFSTNEARWVATLECEGLPQVVVDCPTNPVPECTSIKLTATVRGNSLCPRTYQWCRNGQPIPGATNSMFVTRPLQCPEDEGVVYLVKVVNHIGLGEAACAPQIACDLVGPTIVSVGSLNGRYIGVCFSECVTPDSALNPANYTVTDVNGGHAIVPPIVLRPDGKSVVLCLDVPVCGGFNVRAENIADCCNSNLNSSGSSGLVLGLLDVALDAPGSPGVVFTCDPNPADGIDVDVTAGGADIWGTSDQGHFVYRPAVGDFDMKVQVTRLETVNTWSKAGLDARLSLDAAAPHIMAVFTPFGATQDGSGPGADGIDAGARTTPGGDTTGWGGKGAPTLSVGQNWLRLVRTGNQFLGYWSADGVNWTQHADTGVVPGLPAESFIGLATTSHNNGPGLEADAWYRNFMITPFDLCGRLSIYLAPAVPGGDEKVRPGNVIIDWPAAGCCRLQCTDNLGPGPIVWTDVPGTPPLNLPAGGAHRFYRLIAP